jgi:hypothetical protein
MLRTSELNMVETITPDDVDVFRNNVAWAICSTYHTVLKAFPGVAIFGCNMLFGIQFIANWNKIGDYRQRQTDLSMVHKNNKRINYDYKVGNKVLVTQEGILCKAKKPIQQRAMDYHHSSYEWNYQDSMWNAIRKN